MNALSKCKVSSPRISQFLGRKPLQQTNEQVVLYSGSSMES